MVRLVIFCAALVTLSVVSADLSATPPIRVVDDADRTVVLANPARRIISLAPNTTELLFAAGAGKYVVGTVRFSDYPARAKAIPVVGDANMINMERIISLRPDLIIVWSHVDLSGQLNKLKILGVPIYYSEPRRLEDIPRSISDLGKLAGTSSEAEHAAEQFKERMAVIRQKYAGRPPITVFYQVWRRPLMTVGGRQMINDVIELCGGVNIFQGLSVTVPTVNPESVVAANPDVIVTDYDDGGDDGMAGWRAMKGLHATAWGNLIGLNSPAMGRPSPRILDGADSLCKAFDDARSRMQRAEKH